MLEITGIGRDTVAGLNLSEYNHPHQITKLPRLS